jgi:hypothetical protein
MDEISFQQKRVLEVMVETKLITLDSNWGLYMDLAKAISYGGCTDGSVDHVKAAHNLHSRVGVMLKAEAEAKAKAKAEAKAGGPVAAAAIAVAGLDIAS